MQIESANHAESTGDAREKSAHSYELGFASNLELIFVDHLIQQNLLLPIMSRRCYQRFENSAHALVVVIII
jgi:hypothetical protein